MKASELKDLDLRELVDQLNSLDFENVGGGQGQSRRWLRF